MPLEPSSDRRVLVAPTSPDATRGKGRTLLPEIVMCPEAGDLARDATDAAATAQRVAGQTRAGSASGIAILRRMSHVRPLDPL